MSTNNKRGRPFQGASELRYDMKVRLDEDTHKQLLEYSENNQITVAEAIRRAIRSFLKSK